MRTFLEIASTGITAATMHPLRSMVTVCCLVAVLVPYCTAVAISHGVQHEAATSIQQGADVYISAIRFGQRVPIPAEAVDQVQSMDGVSAAYPRIVGEVFLGKQQFAAVLVGIPPERFPAAVSIVEGRLPEQNQVHELVVGTELARRLKLKVGSLIPPFYHSSEAERVSKVVGIFRSNVSLWQANLVLTTLDTASHIFDQPRLATDLLVECRAGYAERVRERIWRDLKLADPITGRMLQIEVITQRDMQAILPRGLLHREGVFNLHFLPVMVSSILVLLVTSGMGLAERRREIGILKATGWQTDEILLRSFSESLMIGLTGALLALLIAFVWLRLFNGFWIASVFLAGVGRSPSMTIPYRLLPTPALLTIVLSLVVVMTGSLFSSWRAAVATPHSVMR